MNDEDRTSFEHLTRGLLQANARYRELYETHQSLMQGHAALNRVARRLGEELEQERARTQRQLRYILGLRRYLRSEYGIYVSGLVPGEFPIAPSAASSTDRPDRDAASPHE